MRIKDRDQFHHEVPVSLGDRSYTIHIAHGLFGTENADRILGKFIADKSVFLISDSNTGKLFSKCISKSIEISASSLTKHVFKAGEASKNFSSIEKMCRKAAESGMERGSVFVALGGGVCGDMTGFAASIYMRGVDFIQIPTSLLAMIDSSVGGKTGIDLEEGKNLVGSFHQPKLVMIDTSFLRTLPQRELVCGMAEIVKIAVILDSSLFEKLELRHENLLKLNDHELLNEVVAGCCAIKAGVVAADERESSLRAILNYGHTFGHAIEAVSGYTSIAHGEAVSIGMCMAADLAVALNIFDRKSADRQEALLKKLSLPTSVALGGNASENPDRVLKSMFRDKKNVGGKLRLVLPRSIGRAEVFKDVPAEMIIKAIRKRCV